MRKQMLGVVLWANSRATSALIWCEDHGDLAFWEEEPTGAHTGESLDAGDLIRFEVGADRKMNMRRAANLRCVDKGFAPGLAEELRNTAEKPVAGPVSLLPRLRARALEQERKDNVVTFPGVLACA